MYFTLAFWVGLRNNSAHADLILNFITLNSRYQERNIFSQQPQFYLKQTFSSLRNSATELVEV